MTARALMVQGTASSVGKSLIVAALCRLFRRAGLRVAPFKAQNMSLNAAVAEGGGEIGRAQAVQAEAAGVAPTVDMNPILLKPEGDARSQVIVLGRAIGTTGALDYPERAAALKEAIAGALARLRERFDLVVIEGAGSPAEPNLQHRDLANMHVARAADAPVLLAGDIDRGGVFAAFLGTLELLAPADRARVAGLLVNKFRGDRRLLEPGLDFLTARTGLPVLGVLPYLRDLRIADEDSVALDERRARPPREGELEIAVVRAPRISNHDDVAPLEHEPGVAVRFVTRPEELAGADLVVLPGSKCTAADLAWLRERGLAGALAARAARGEPILGLCGGCQMMGEALLDPDGVESPEPRVPGLGLLPLVTRFGREKRTANVRARLATPSLLGPAGAAVSGYEIHVGEVERAAGVAPALVLQARNGAPCAEADGVVAGGGALVGTLVHGLFEDAATRTALLAGLRARRGLVAPSAPAGVPSREAEYDRLARGVGEQLDWTRLCRIAGVDAPLPPLDDGQGPAVTPGGAG